MKGARLIVTQGQQAVSARETEVISTLLGSCVACCLWDPDARVGGMNHMLVTSLTARDTNCFSAGVNAMELLINAVLKAGGTRGRLQAKAFGGAAMRDGMTNVGAHNCKFILDFLDRENIPCQSQSLGGTSARHLLFWPTTGAAKLRIVKNPPPLEPEVSTTAAPAGNGMELF